MLAETCIVSTAFVDGLQDRALAEARSAAEEALRERKASQGAASTPAEGGYAISPSCSSAVIAPLPGRLT